jgi:predicted adenine nucleotide alpha hydrolase (AANH) superfamily ATPase
MTALLLHTCCGPCSTVAVPAWRERGVEPVGWFENPNVQPVAELERRRDSMRRYSRAAGLELIVPDAGEEAPAWRRWREDLREASPDARCAACLRLRLGAAGAAARELGFARFSTTLTVSPYQRHDLIRDAGEAAADQHGVDFVYLDVRTRYRHSYAESRRLDLYRQPYCGCVASKWDAWHARRARRGRTA